MKQKELIQRIIHHDDPPRLGWDFQDQRYQDILHVPSAELVNSFPPSLYKWGRHPSLLEKVKWFGGEVRLDAYGNLYGRLNEIGNCETPSKQANKRTTNNDYSKINRKQESCVYLETRIMPSRHQEKHFAAAKQARHQPSSIDR